MAMLYCYASQPCCTKSVYTRVLCIARDANYICTVPRRRPSLALCPCPGASSIGGPMLHFGCQGQGGVLASYAALPCARKRPKQASPDAGGTTQEYPHSPSPHASDRSHTTRLHQTLYSLSSNAPLPLRGLIVLLKLGTMLFAYEIHDIVNRPWKVICVHFSPTLANHPNQLM